MIRIYFILNLLLAVVAVMATGWLLSGRETARLPAFASPPADPAERTRIDDASIIPAPITVAVTGQEVESLWENVIFNPDRRERFELDTAPAVTAEERISPPNMELMAIGMVGTRSAAVIVVQDPRPRSPDPRRRPTPEPRRTRNVYSLGEVIDGTGYTITGISMEEVILSRGDEERVLRLIPTNEASRQRREVAVRQEGEERRRQDRTQLTGERQESLPPPPPPLIPASDAESEAEESDMTREERAQQIIERRREALEELRRRQRAR